MNAGELEADVIVVGAGATGAAAARALVARGLDVLLLDAGPAHAAEILQPKSGLVAGVRGLRTRARQSVQRTHPRFEDKDARLWVDDVDNPYETDAGSPFAWIRGRQVGGRTLTWGGVALRLGTDDLRESSDASEGAAWPLSLEELAPAYERAERAFAVVGPVGTPWVGNGGTLAPASPTVDALVERVRGFREDAQLLALPRAGTTAAGGAWPASTAQGSFLDDAPGSLRIRPHSVARRVLVQDGVATGVQIVDATSGASATARARAVILAAGAIESTRLLLLSEVAASPTLGRFLVDHVTVEVTGEVDVVRPAAGQRVGLLVPDLRLSGERGRFGVWGFVDGSSRGSRMTLIAQAEASRRADNRVGLSTTVRDRHGIPSPDIRYRWAPEDLARAGDMATQLEELARALGARVTRATRVPPPPGRFVHEAGTAAMSAHEETGVVDERGRVRGVAGLVLVDGAVAPRLSWQHPTLTWAAFALLAADQLADDLGAAAVPASTRAAR